MDKMINISTKISGIKYNPLLCRNLNTFNFEELENVLSKEATFILKIDDKNQIAVSWWVSSKRTRSYPYSRIYDSLSFSGKKITIIPVFKDEGLDGDRDFLQWDTISLMSLLGIYVIISYYKTAEQNKKYENKITNQRFNIEQIKSKIKKLFSYQSDALHWNLEQIDKVGEVSKKALESYDIISEKLGVKMHSKESAENRIKRLLKGKDAFMNLSRDLAQKAQQRESVTIQPKEMLNGTKSKLTIKNYLGGNYFFTADEAEISNEEVLIIEAKHTDKGDLPSFEDIKDGLLKMVLFVNLEDVKINSKNYIPIPVLKLTSKSKLDVKSLENKYTNILEPLKKEAGANGFKIKINNEFIN